MQILTPCVMEYGKYENERTITDKVKNDDNVDTLPSALMPD